MLDISIGLILTTAVIFFALIYFLNSMLYKPLLDFMKQRDETISKDLENSQKEETGSDELREEARNIISKAKQEAAKIKTQAQEEAKELIRIEISKTKQELAKEYEKFQKELSEKRETIKAALISQAPLFREALKAKLYKL